MFAWPTLSALEQKLLNIKVIEIPFSFLSGKSSYTIEIWPDPFQNGPHSVMSYFTCLTHANSLN